jgi:GPH family glycoside/pentoside/hexuronide:cation symporter
VAYAAPMAGFMAASLPISIWFGKFGTDTLLIPAAAIGTIVMIARIWDGFSDPLAGTLSDRTRTRFGRRRSWMLAAVLPMMVTLAALWSPPAGLEGLSLILWMGAFYVLWETASTALVVPYAALGNELTENYHERTRIFGWRHLISVAGYATALGFVYLMRTAGDRSPAEGREMATTVALAGGVIVAAGIVWAVRVLPEPAAHQGRGGVNVWRAVRDVFRNPHARILLAVYGVEAFGMGSLSFLAPYVLEDVIGEEGYLEVVLLAWVLPQFVFTPIWMNLSRRFGKKPLWMAGMVLYAFAFTGNLLVMESGVAVLFAIVFLLGIGGGIGNVVAPAIQADVIDWDELQTGERKEGAYTAVWNLIRKGGWGVAAGVGGLALGWSGYDGAAESQTETVQWTIIVLVSLVPGGANVIGALLMRRFGLNQAEHAEVLRRIRERD